ncbi:MAG: hypothetical protein ACE5Q6_09370 [Dehalococcoidia bacterium]
MPEAGPLDILAHQLQGRAPPSLAAVLHALVPEEGFAEFMELIMEYLPEHQADILAGESATAQVAIFANRFRDRYFPLPYFEDAYFNDFSYADLLSGIPMYFLGMDWDDWHELPYFDGLGRRLLVSLIASPWASDDDGARVALVESFKREVPQELLERIPQGGYQPADLHRWVDDTQFHALALLADVVWFETGITFIDMDEESMPLVAWDPDNVWALTQEWLRAEQIYREIGELEEWLEHSPGGRFAQLLDFIDQRKACPEQRRRETPSLETPSGSPGPNTPLIDVFDEGERR